MAGHVAKRRHTAADKLRSINMARNDKTEMTTTSKWIWPSNDEINDFPDPLGFEAEWKPWAGTMANDHASTLAEIFVRELVQNSWDSIQEFTKGREQDVVADRGVEFREVVLEGAAAEDFAQRFGLHEHASRFSKISDRHRKDSRLEDSVVVQDQLETVRLLVVNERWGGGMWGPWKTNGRPGIVSLLKSALIQTKSEKQNAASGGSWGHGKKGIANASSCRTLAVYTCSPAHNEDKVGGAPVTRRFLGVSYWRSHDIPNVSSHVGLGLLGATPASGLYGEFAPLENDQADTFVHQLNVPGLDQRDPAVPGQAGVSYLIVEPSFEIDQLAGAVARNWWPLMLQYPNAIRVFDKDGAALPCGHEGIAELEPFVHAHRIATEQIEPKSPGEAQHSVNDGSFGPVGHLGLASDVREEGWSYQDPETNTSLVALVRNDMVIAYQPFPLERKGKAPFIRGTFVVDRANNDKASEGLKMSEPHLHNEWIRKPAPSVPKEYADLARRTLEKVAKEVGSLKDSLRDHDDDDQHHYREFSRFWSGSSVTKGRGAPKPDPIPPKKARDHSIQFVNEEFDINIDDPTVLRIRCTVKFALLPRAAKEHKKLRSEIDLGWGVLEERGPVRDSSLTNPHTVVAPPGFALVDGKYTGDVTAEPVEFYWESQFFSDDWQVVPDPRITAAAPSNPEEEAK